MRHYSLWLDKYDKRKGQILSSLREYKKQIELIMEKIPSKELILPLKDSHKELNSKMCFVDGGEGIRELLGASVYFIRASGLIMSRLDDKEHNEFFVRDLDMNIIDHDEHTKERVELLRDAMEFDVAISCIEGYKPDYLFLDGSLYVKARKKPIECEEYPIYRKKFVRLLKLCRKKSVHVLGVSEDSKSKLLANYLAMKYNVKFPKFMTDSGILRLLAQNTKFRTIEFTPQSQFEADDKISPTIVLSFPTVYLQPTELSNPLRIDVPDWESSFDEIIDIVIELSKGSRHYGYPLPLYLAHLDARIHEKQSEWSTAQIVHHILKHDNELYNAIMRGNRRSARPV